MLYRTGLTLEFVGYELCLLVFGSLVDVLQTAPVYSGAEAIVFACDTTLHRGSGCDTAAIGGLMGSYDGS